MVMKRRYLFLVIIFSVTCMLLVQTNFDSLFPSHEWRSKFYSLSNLDSWTTSNSRRTVLSRSSSSFDGSEVDPNGQTGRHGKEENGNIDPENDQRLKSMVKSRTGSEYQASSSPSLSKGMLFLPLLFFEFLLSSSLIFAHLLSSLDPTFWTEFSPLLSSLSHSTFFPSVCLYSPSLILLLLISIIIILFSFPLDFARSFSLDQGCKKKNRGERKKERRTERKV